MISLIHDDSVNLADLQNKIIEIQDYLNTRKNDIINNMVSLNIENYTIDYNKYYKKTKLYNGTKLLSKNDNSYDWVEIPIKENIDLSHAHEINIIFKNNNKVSNLFIVKKSGTYKDIDQTIIVSILENNLIIDNVEKVSNIFIR